MKQNLRQLGLIASLVFLIIPSSGSAASDPKQGLGLELAPPIIEFSVNPGQIKTIPLQVRNVTQGDLTAITQVNDFKAKNEGGDPGIIFNETETPPFSIKGWVEDIGKFPIAAQAITTVNVRVAVPKDAEPGGHYGVVRFAVTPEGFSSQGVAVGASIGALLIITVNGPIKHNLSIAQFAVGQSGRFKNFFAHGPFTFTERLKNDGTVHEKPSGYIDIYGFGGKRITTLIVNNNPIKNVLPSSIRRFEQTYANNNSDPKLGLGRYRADFNLIYGPNNTPLKSTIYFWVIPFPSIMLLLLIVLILIVLIGRKYLKKSRPRRS